MIMRGTFYSAFKSRSQYRAKTTIEMPSICGNWTYVSWLCFRPGVSVPDVTLYVPYRAFGRSANPMPCFLGSSFYSLCHPGPDREVGVWQLAAVFGG